MGDEKFSDRDYKLAQFVKEGIIELSPEDFKKLVRERGNFLKKKERLEILADGTEEERARKINEMRPEVAGARYVHRGKDGCDLKSGIFFGVREDRAYVYYCLFCDKHYTQKEMQEK